MDYKEIERLLERYWNGETTLDEEQDIRSFFVNEQVPPHLLKYKQWFIQEQQLKDASLSSDFEQRIMQMITDERVKAQPVSLWNRMKPLLRGMAAVVLLCLIGNSVRDSISVVGDSRNGVSEGLVESATDSSVALSNNNASVKEQQLIDTVHVLKKGPAVAED